MKRFRETVRIMLLMILLVCIAVASAEAPAEEKEQGLDEIQTLIELAEVNGTEGMGLEEMTDAFTESAMSEYVDSATGFSMQYPSVFVFDEGEAGFSAATADGKATLAIENMANSSALDEGKLIEGIRWEIPGAVPQKNEQNGCLRFDRKTDNGKTVQTDLYLLTEKSLHHIIIRYPAEEEQTYQAYIEYMINTMETNETELG